MSDAFFLTDLMKNSLSKESRNEIFFFSLDLFLTNKEVA